MTREIDASGLKCPLPVLRARKALQDIAPGEGLVVLATDAAAPRDFEAFCREAGHRLISCEEREGTFRIELSRAEP